MLHSFSPYLYLSYTNINQSNLDSIRFRIKTETGFTGERTYVGSTIFILYPPFLLWCGVVTRRVYQLSFYFILLYHGQTLLHINQSFLFVHTNIQIVTFSLPRMHTIMHEDSLPRMHTITYNDVIERAKVRVW